MCVLLLCVVGVNGLFTKTGCDRSAIDDMLNAQEGITEQNVLQYLGIVEARSNHLILARAYMIKHQVSVKPTQHLLQNVSIQK